MNTFTSITILVTISGLISYLNHRFVKLPGTIGIMVIAIAFSVLIMLTGKTFPAAYALVSELTSSIDFTKTLLDVMLAFLLFASALHFDYQKLKEQKRTVLILSTVGVIGCTTIFGFLLYWIGPVIGVEIPLIYCFLFGALISPTDPVAVLSVLKKSKIPPSLETIIGGESLFNDGVGILLFVTLRELTVDTSVAFSWSHSGELFIQEVFGGILLGVISGYFCTRLAKKVDDLQTILMITISMVMGISVIGGLLHVSIPLAAVSAGLMLSNMELGESKGTFGLKSMLDKIWGLIDDLLNTILFVMIGLQIVVIPFFTNYWAISLLSVVFVLIARGVSIAAPGILLRRSLKVDYNRLGILIWAGLRGGISVALALSLPDSDYKPLIVSASYTIVIFSIIVQGLTLNKVVDRLVK
ncbi:cation:proton antiporter [Pedobacter antarcticus]|uniref:Sodium:proton antiporter n=2 Tax=Pedobacter antarcticus TaxID=34086 RepID=A0A081PKE4_9SPHI|nr:sodium:proton antiporter [Pedobacter antarcticus]KEQ31167.1 sodium:proton antiporter [Pedobacter antarcticus 4BY]SDM91021.1 sodium/proton antiporter, CPA1 family [Pedobacter antarcticus]SFE53839.1 sodium/proton antiporter, CPA1 family [Pedobacter antarcticus]